MVSCRRVWARFTAVEGGGGCLHRDDCHKLGGSRGDPRHRGESLPMHLRVHVGSCRPCVSGSGRGASARPGRGQEKGAKGLVEQVGEPLHPCGPADAGDCPGSCSTTPAHLVRASQSRGCWVRVRVRIRVRIAVVEAERESRHRRGSRPGRRSSPQPTRCLAPSARRGAGTQTPCGRNSPNPAPTAAGAGWCHVGGCDSKGGAEGRGEG